MLFYVSMHIKCKIIKKPSSYAICSYQRPWSILRRWHMPAPGTAAKEISQFRICRYGRAKNHESWLFHSDTDPTAPLQGLFQHRKQPVTDLAVWMQCYASLISVLIEKYPQYTKHFLAYMATITTGYKRFKGLCWVAYDTAYRRKAAGVTWINTSIPYGSLIKPRIPTALAVSIQLKPTPTFLLPSQPQMQANWNQPPQRPMPMHAKQVPEPCGLSTMQPGILAVHSTHANMLIHANLAETTQCQHAPVSLENTKKMSTGSLKSS